MGLTIPTRGHIWPDPPEGEARGWVWPNVPKGGNCQTHPNFYQGNAILFEHMNLREPMNPGVILGPPGVILGHTGTPWDHLLGHTEVTLDYPGVPQEL